MCCVLLLTTHTYLVDDEELSSIDPLPWIQRVVLFSCQLAMAQRLESSPHALATQAMDHHSPKLLDLHQMEWLAVFICSDVVSPTLVMVTYAMCVGSRVGVLMKLTRVLFECLLDCMLAGQVASMFVLVWHR